ncbi:MAG: BrnA antitoxin family protein [candidate division KSB1 bacterium]|nr:BrnA antitoxin family protein [candidate division KSB1 bacterium]MDZ7365197.1 BrnA antitoxin family protein [candidate division KSB1 bacterium]
MPKSDLKRIDKMRDQDIDYSDIPPLTEEQLASMQPWREVLSALAREKTRVTISLDADVLKWFKKLAQNSGGKSYQALMNAVLRQYIELHQVPRQKSRRLVKQEELPAVE